MDLLFSFATLVGIFTLIGVIKTFLPYVLVMVSPRSKSYYTKMGKWAIITGATDGIGKAYAQALAKRGMNILLISRTQKKLDACAEEIKSEFKVETKVLAADFSKCSEPGFAAPIEAMIKGMDVGVLVNNVGLSYPYPKCIADDECDWDLLDSLIKLNVYSTTVMTKIVIPGMKERKRGLVVSLSSAAGNMPCGSPMLAGYSATKAYISAFSKSIAYEVGSGITLQTHVPYFVVTNMSKIRKSSLMIPTPKAWVESSLKIMGYGSTTIVPYFAHFVQDYLAQCIPEGLAGWYTLRLHKDIRRRAIKKAEREAAAKTQ